MVKSVSYNDSNTAGDYSWKWVPNPHSNPYSNPAIPPSIDPRASEYSILSMLINTLVKRIEILESRVKTLSDLNLVDEDVENDYEIG